MPAKKKRVNNASTGRNYAYDKAFAARPEQKRRRADRNKARRKAIKSGAVRKGDGKDIDHGSPSKKGSLAKRRTRVMSASKNRAKNGHRKGEKRGKRR